MDHRISDVMLTQCKKENIVYRTKAYKCLGDILVSLELDKYGELFSLVKNIMGMTVHDEDEEGLSAEEIAKNRENFHQLKVASYEVMGKSWIPTTANTQERYSETFLSYYVELDRATRTVQISMLEAVYNFVQNLKVLQKKHLSTEEESLLNIIFKDLSKIITYSLGECILIFTVFGLFIF